MVAQLPASRTPGCGGRFAASMCGTSDEVIDCPECGREVVFSDLEALRLKVALCALSGRECPLASECQEDRL